MYPGKCREIARYRATDAPLTPSQADACKGCIQIPVMLGTTAILYNVPGVTKQIRMTGKILAGIYLGSISKWNDAALTAINPDAGLPDLKITPAYRSDGSGTSYNFTDFLTSVSPDWSSKVGKSTQPAFPAGVGARGSSGVAGIVTSTPGAIGYADVAYAVKNKIRFAAVKNKHGDFATPGIRAGAAAASTVTSVPADNAISIVNPPASDKTKIAYPISTFVWVIVPQTSSKAKLIKQFLLFAISNQGQALGRPLLYPPMPKIVQIASAKTIAKITQG